MFASLRVRWYCRRVAAGKEGGHLDTMIRIGGAAVPPFIHALKHHKSGVRRMAAQALGGIADQRAVVPLIAVLDDPDWLVVTSAAEALARIGDPRAVEPLIAKLQDPQNLYHVAVNLGKLARKLGDRRAFEPLLAAFQGGSRGSHGAAEGLGELGDARAVEPLVTKLTHCRNSIDRKDSMAPIIAKALGKLGDARAISAIVPLLKSSYEYTRETAEEALKRLGGAKQIAEAQRDVARAKRAIALRNQPAVDAITAQIREGMSYGAVVAVLGSPSETIGGSDVLGAFGKVGGSAHGMARITGMTFFEWRRKEGTYRATFTNGVLTELNAWPAEE
jgi:HEAT repeat protein